MLPETECRCGLCAELCLGQPGWFLPGEATKAAAELGLTLKEFALQYLVIEYWTGNPDIELLAPRKTYQVFGRAAFSDAWKEGPCALLSPSGCKLSASARPHECRLAFGCDKPSKHGPEVREQIAKKWNELGDEVKECQ